MCVSTPYSVYVTNVPWSMLFVVQLSRVEKTLFFFFMIISAEQWTCARIIYVRPTAVDNYNNDYSFAFWFTHIYPQKKTDEIVVIAIFTNLQQIFVWSSHDLSRDVFMFIMRFWDVWVWLVAVLVPSSTKFDDKMPIFQGNRWWLSRYDSFLCTPPSRWVQCETK